MNQKGFTLVELVVVAVLLAFLASLLFGSMRGIIQTRETTEESTKILKVASVILSTLTDELSSRANVPVRVPTEGSGVGEIRNRSRYMLGFHFQKGAADTDRLRFTARGKAKATLGEHANFGDVQIEYRLEETEDGFTGGQIRRFTLIREESPAVLGDVQSIEQRTHRLALADNVAALRFRYLKNARGTTNWQREWQGRDLRHPLAIEISLSLVDDADKVHSFRTAVTVSESRSNQLGFRSIGGA